MVKDSKKEKNPFLNDRKLEVNTHNEQIILSSIIKSKPMRLRIFEKISADDFIGLRHKVIFQVIKKIDDDELEFNEDTFIQIASDQDFGGIEYLREVLKSYDKNLNIDFHIARLKEDRLKYKLFTGKTNDFVEALVSKDTTKEDLLKISNNIQEMISSQSDLLGVVEGKKVVDIYIDDLKERLNKEFIGTGYLQLDEKLTEGFAPSIISVIAGRPGMGKTILMANIIMQLARSKKILVCEIETGTLSLIDIMMSCYTGIPLINIVKHHEKLSESDNKRLRDRVKRTLSNPNFHFLDDPELSLDRLEIQLKSKKYDVCFIDLFGRLTDIKQTPEGFTEKLYQAKRIARKTKTHLCLIHQVKRTNDKEKSKRPTLDKLKGSGAWEEAGDLILGVHRERYYRPQLKSDIIEIWILKQKRGEQGIMIPFDFNGHICEIGDYKENYFFGKNLEDF